MNNRNMSEKLKVEKAVKRDDAAVLDSAVFAVCAQDLPVFSMLFTEVNSPFPEDIRGLCKDEEEVIQAKDGKRNERDHRGGRMKQYKLEDLKQCKK